MLSLRSLYLSALCAILCSLPLARSATGGGPSLLETPTYTLAGVLLFFLILSTVFERSTHLLIWFLKKHNRHGLATAVSNLVMELTLIGFISLILMVFQNKIHAICVPYSGESYESWALLHNVEGCDCCLADTAGVGYCFQASRGCGNDFCNCGGVDRCEVEEGLRRMLGESGGGTEEKDCDGAMELELQTCPEHQAPLVSLNALHQVHLFIFAVAVGHVVLGVVMILLADWRMRLWRHWAEEEDEHAQEVRRVLEGQQAALAPTTRSRFSSFRHFIARRAHLGASGRGSASASGRASPGTPSTPSWGGRWRHWASFSKSQRQEALEDGGAAAAVAAVAASPTAAAATAATGVVQGVGAGTVLTSAGQLELAPSARATAAGQPAECGDVAAAKLPTIPSATSLHDAELGGTAGSLQGGQAGQQKGWPANGDTKLVGPGRGSSPPGALPGGKAGEVLPGRADGSQLANGHRRDASDGSGKGIGLELEEVEGTSVEDKGGAGDGSGQASYNNVRVACTGEVGEAGPPTAWRGRRRILQRTGTIKTRQGWVWEWFVCLLTQLLPSPLSKEDFSIMRASFMLTHRVPKSFDFMAYIQNSMEDDFAHVVGVSLEMWLTLIVFILVSGKIGWPVLLFLVLAGLIQIITDAKLVQIMRHVCRGGRVNRLASNIFWLQRPPLMLVPIKFMLFLCSFIFSTTAFFAAVYGSQSCPLGENGFWFAWVAPWWISLVAAGYILFLLSFRTLPLYSLCVQMGSDFKSSMLPRGVREKLLYIAQHIKQKRREHAAAGGSGLDVHRAALAVKSAGRLLPNPPKH